MNPRKANFDIWGIVPTFLDETDPRPASAQFNEFYIGGWKHFPKFKRTGDTLTYPGDPPMNPIDSFKFHDETITMYPSSWVCITQPDGTWEISRMD